MKSYFGRIRYQDLVAVAAVSAIVAGIFLALGLVWRSTGFALLSAAFWFRVWKMPVTPAAASNALDSKKPEG